jgi:hypothetical protein
MSVRRSCSVCMCIQISSNDVKRSAAREIIRQEGGCVVTDRLAVRGDVGIAPSLDC